MFTQPNKYGNSLCLANYIVIAFIPTLFFGVMLLGYLHIIPLNIPLSGISIIGFILFIFLLFIQHNANYSICKIRKSSLILEKAIENKIEKNSLTIETQTKSLLSMEPFLNKYYTDVRNDNFASVASSIFPMLGILGTFIAIAISMPDFSIQDTQALDHEISLLLSGVGSAFFASIYGILLSLIWTYFEKRGVSKIEHYFQEVTAKHKNKLWSDDELRIYKYAQYDYKKLYNIDFVQKMSEQHLDSFEKITTQTMHNFTTLSEHLQNVSQELTQSLANMEINHNALKAQNHIDKAIVDFTVATKSFEKTTKLFSLQLENSLDKTFHKIDSEVGNIVIKLADFATHVSLESKEVQDSIAKYHAMVANQLKMN